MLWQATQLRMMNEFIFSFIFIRIRRWEWETQMRERITHWEETSRPCSYGGHGIFFLCGKVEVERGINCYLKLKMHQNNHEKTRSFQIGDSGRDEILRKCSLKRVPWNSFITIHIIHTNWITFYEIVIPLYFSMMGSANLALVFQTHLLPHLQDVYDKILVIEFTHHIVLAKLEIINLGSIFCS